MKILNQTGTKFSTKREDFTISKPTFISSSKASCIGDGKIRVSTSFISQKKLKVKSS